MREHLASSGVGTLLESWFPLGGKDNCGVLFSDKTIAEIASNHGVSSAQTLIRWHLQTGNWWKRGICLPHDEAATCAQGMSRAIALVPDAPQLA